MRGSEPVSPEASRDLVQYLVRLELCLEHRLVSELLFAQHVDEVEQIGPPQVQRGRRQEDQDVGPVREQLPELVAARASVAERVGFVDDHQVEPGVHVGERLKCAVRRAKGFERDDA